jgi:hypothetical protein
MRRPGDHEESVLPNRTYPGESQGGIAISKQAPLPYALAAPESHGAPAYVIYKVGVTLEITSFSTSRLRKFHMGMHAHTY